MPSRFRRPVNFSDLSQPAFPLWLLRPQTLEKWLGEGPGLAHEKWVNENSFRAKPGQTLVLPGTDGTCAGAIVGLGDEGTEARRRFTLASAVAKLPEASWRIETPLDASAAQEAALAWLLAGYRFDKYATSEPPEVRLKPPENVDPDRLMAIASGEFLTRDLINTPANDMGPDNIERAANDLAAVFGAKVSVIKGAALLEENFPLIHAVGRAADQEPRLIELNWGISGPKVTLVGKGVAFDTGGLNLKPGSSMGLMKKDMGGAATILGLSSMIMETEAPVRLRVLVPAVENSVSAGAMRPGDILRSRSGLTVEVNNTDAEGRLVLADALALASEAPPDLLVSMATLTGAARVAVGPDLAPFYTDDAWLAEQLMASGAKVADPVWRMPFWDPYEAMIEPGIADLDNAPKGGFAGSITAALFLRRFAKVTPYAHFDIYGWQPTAAPGRPKGGAGQGARALFEVIDAMARV